MPTAVEQVLYTAVPNGISSNGLELMISVYVSPTLSGGATGTLTDFPDFQDWPSTFGSQNLELAVTFSNQTKSVTQPISALANGNSPALNPSLWTALFSPPSGVQYSARDAGEPYTGIPVVSYPAAGASGLASFLQSTYTNLVVNSPTSHPSLESLQSIYNNGNGPLGNVGAAGIRLLNDLWSELSDERLGIFETHAASPTWANDWTSATPAQALAALRFYHMAAGPGLTHTLPATTLPVVDFHRALTFLNQHRALQRALGLVFDITILADDVRMLQSALSSNFYISVVPVNANGAPFVPSNGVTYTPVTPRTQCDASTSVFQAHAVSPQIVGRQLTLGDTSSFSVYEIDVDGGGLHTAQFADNLALAQSPQSGDPSSSNGPAPDAPTSAAPPALRSLGLTVAAVNRGLGFVAALQRSASLLAGLPSSVPDLTAEDLVKGYVLDVYDAAGATWHSTSQRDVTYAVSSLKLGPFSADEPGTDAPPRSQSDPTKASQPQLNLPENIIRWNGWSNAAPRPGLPLQDDGSASLPTDPGPFNQLTIAGLTGSGPVTVTPGSLPRLRFGASYAVRARVVDIAGNVLSLSDPTLASIGDSQKRVSAVSIYGRHEPVGAPDIYNWTTALPGESLKRLVIRDLAPTLGCARAFAPNRIAESFAELHGVFDTGSGGALDGSATTYNLIVAQESARYPQQAPPASATPAQQLTPLWQQITLTSPVPYLPDPLARGGTLFETQGSLSGNSYMFDFNPASGPASPNWQGYPNYQPFGLMLMPGSSQAVQTDETHRQLTFTLTPGDTVILQLSSRILASDLPYLGTYNWISTFYGGSVPSALQSDAVNGLTWAMTPYTTLQLVYAVQQPLLKPVFPPNEVFANRALAWTFAEITGDLTYSPKSTARTDLLASWGDPVDNGAGTGAPIGPGAPDTTLAQRTSTVFTVPSTLTQQSSATQRFNGRHELFDTKHREVTYSASSTSAFTEHYQGSIAVTVPSPGTAVALTLPGEGNLGVEPGSVTITGSNGTVYPDSSFTIDASAGTITFVANAGGPATGTAVTIDFLPTVSVEMVSPVTLDILSSARPLTPDIAFVVPIYEWRKVHKSGSTITSGRSGSALRIFMSRPWWTSGIGEQLGVVTWPEAENTDIRSTIPATDGLYVSDWGLDPVFAGRDLPSAHPRLETFPKRVDVAKNLTIDENASVTVNVAGHEVKYDPVRDLWYCDVVVNIGESYTPMIRLALARYQPDSVKGAELSRIVLADVMSLEPGRAVLIKRKSPTLLESVVLAGYSYRSDGDQARTGPGLAELVVERRVPAVKDAVIGWEPVAKPIVMHATTDKKGLTVWTARNVAIPAGGTHRLYLVQYEVVPTDRRRASISIAYEPSDGVRILYQDIIPLP